MSEILLVGLGSALGGMARYGAGLFAARFTGLGAFPLATFAVNILGCFLLGFLGGYFAKNGADAKLALLATTGFCGGFTTFSTFSRETLALFANDFYALGVFYVISSVILGLIAVAAGFWLSNLNI
jgi:CrcB protein